MDATSLEVRLENIFGRRYSGRQKTVGVMIEEVKTTYIRAYLHIVLSITALRCFKGVSGRG